MCKRRLGAALLTALVSMAIGASSAQAINWTATGYTAVVAGEQELGLLTFGFENSTKVQCKELGFVGELAEARTSLTLKGPAGTIGKCEAFGFEGNLTMNECTFVLKPTAGSGDSFFGTLDISCPAGKKMVFKGANCEVSVGSHSALNTATFHTETTKTPNPVDAAFGINTVTYTKDKDGIACPLSGTGPGKNGSISGGLRLWAFKKETSLSTNLGLG